MKCDFCHKNDATIHIQEILNGKKKNLNICAECASEKNIAEAEIEGFNLSEILYNLSSQMMNNASPQKEDQSHDHFNVPHSTVVCGKCGWDTNRFRDSGRLGCAECYSVFDFLLGTAIKNMHKGNIHIGKHPGIANSSNAELAMRVMSLQKELEQHVLKEQYEEAAKIRDRINELKKGTGK